jgi:hypothetical protein
MYDAESYSGELVHIPIWRTPGNVEKISSLNWLRAARPLE